MTDAYRDDLAYIHNAGFVNVARNAAEVLLKELRRTGLERGRVIDLGCGSGIVAHAAAAAGYDVLGIDISPAMIALAQERVPAGEFRVGSLLSADIPPCVAVAAVGECLNYLFDTTNTKAALQKLLRRIFKALECGGVLILDVAGPGRVGPVPRRGYTEGRDWAVLYTAEEDRQHRFMTRQITSFRQAGELYRRDAEVHRLRLIAPEEMTEQLRAAGFRVRRLRSYGELRLGPGHTAFLAQKRNSHKKHEKAQKEE